jgi:hypothetical protein
MDDQPKGKDQGSGQTTEPAPVEPPRPRVPFVPGPVISEPEEVLKILGPTGPKGGGEEV